MPTPMDVVKVLPTVERATGITFAEVMKAEGFVDKAITSIVGRNPFQNVARQLDDFGINWIGVNKAGGGMERMSAANTQLTNLRGDTLSLKPLQEGDRFVFGTRAFGSGRAESINVHPTMASMWHSEGVLSKTNLIAPNTARDVHFMNVRGHESVSTFDGFHKSGSSTLRGLFGDVDPARSMSAKYGYFGSRPEYTHSRYLHQRPGSFGPADNPIRTDVSSITRFRNGTTELYPVRSLGDKTPAVPLKYDARNNLII